MTTLEQVRLELREMQKLGIRVPRAAYSVMSESAVQEYRDNGMKISEIADLAIQLADVRS